MAILVTGGAGYIGSATVLLLRQAGEQVVVLDNLSKGHRAAVSASVPFYEGDVGDTTLVTRICREHGIEACIHFAAFTDVGESVEKPHEYYSNNVAHSFTLLAALQAAAVRHVVFSSTCATYGEPLHLPIDETHPQSPCNPYGWSKLMLERVLTDYDRAFGLRFVALRYFNAAGALPECGEDHRPETHLIPIVLQTALGQRPQVTVFGNDYDTPDGTPVRDYIHIADLGQAHLKALQYLRTGGGSEMINLGNGNGYSVLEVIETARRVSRREIPAVIAARRAGDAVRLIADAGKAAALLGWQPQFPELQTIIETAWAWHSARPDGYKK
ncbi:MAG: UDP-glucose 4-epimerase GalE [Lentisphaeria bacterium]|jgi:UDP-glucose 4-epimerase|nr:UDP-glucose 4-epimerase GalE [Lentisphaeria bacterium]MDP7741458.1 UDP-glucose 4-epimerase GalE [Lentisphaeria bacterium]